MKIPRPEDFGAVASRFPSLGELDQTLLDRRERPQGLRLRPELRRAEHVLRRVRRNAGELAVHPVLVGEMSAASSEPPR